MGWGDLSKWYDYNRKTQAYVNYTWSSDSTKCKYTITGYARSGDGTGNWEAWGYTARISIWYQIDGGTWQTLGSGDYDLNYHNSVPSGGFTKILTVNRTKKIQKLIFAVNVDSPSGYWPTARAYTGIDTLGALASYTVAYNGNKPSNANGTPTSVPDNQTKWYGENLSLSTTKPTLAQDTISSYTITYDYQNGTGSPGSASAIKKRTWTLNSSYPWNTKADGSGTKYAAGATYSGNAALTLYAQWNSSTSGGSVTLPTPTRSNYTFGGWYTAANGGGTKAGNAGATYTSNASIKLYAKWTPNNYTITLNKNNGSGTITTSYNQAINTEVSLPSSGLTRTGYDFKGWSTSSSATSGSYKYKGSTDITLYAAWALKTYTISYTVPTTDWSKPASQTKTYGQALTLTAAPTRNNTTVTYTITYDYKGGTGSTSSASATTTTSYTFKHWKWTHDGTTTTYAAKGSFTTNTSATLVAVTTSTTNIGTVKLPNTSKVGYDFIGWYNGNAQIGGGGNTYPLNTSMTVCAGWTPHSYTIIFNGNGATGSMASMPMSYGTPATLPENAFEKTGYHFKNWNSSLNGTGSSYKVGQEVNNLTSVDEGQVNLYAQWTPDTYSVKYYRDNNDLFGSQTVTYDVTWTIPTSIPTKTYYTFNYWSDNNILYYPGETISSYTATTGTDLYAIWNINEYTVSYNYNGGTPKEETPSSVTTTQGSNVSLPSASDINSPTVSSTWTLALNINTKDKVKILTSSPESETPSYIDAPQTINITWTSALNESRNKLFNGWSLSENNTGAGEYTTVFPKGTEEFEGWEYNYPAKNSTTTLFAQWANPTSSLTHTFSFNAVNIESSSVNINTALVRDNYAFKGWSYGVNDSNVITSEQYEITNSSTAYIETLYAQWEPTTYKIAYYGNEVPSAVINGVTYSFSPIENLPEEQIVSLGASSTVISSKIPKIRATISSASGYDITFNFQDETTFPQKYNVTYERVFNQWDWKLYSDDSSATIIASGTINPGQSFTKPAGVQGNYIVKLTAQWNNNKINDGIRLLTPNRTGYVFNGWYLEPEYKNQITSDSDGYWKPNPIANTNLYAKWSPYSYEINYNVDGDTDLIPQQTAFYGDIIPITSIRPTRSSNIQKYNINLYKEVKENIDSFSNEQWIINSESLTQNPYDTRSFNVNQSYQFEKWKLENQDVFYLPGTNLDTTKIISQNSDEILNLESQWLEQTNIDSIYLPTLNAKDGWIFEEWHIYAKINNNNAISYQFLESWNSVKEYIPPFERIQNIENFESLIIIPSWAQSKYTITYNLNGGATTASISYLTDTKNYNLDYNLNNAIEVTWTSVTNNYSINAHSINKTTLTDVTTTLTYSFSGWDLDQYKNGTPSYVPVPNEDSITPAYTKNSDAIFYAQRTVARSGGLNLSSLISSPADIPTGYENTPLWYKNEAYTIPVLTENGVYYPTKNEDLYAKWILKQYKVQYNSNGGDSNTLPDEGIKLYGQDFVIPDVVPFYNDHVFIGWKDQYNNIYSPGASISLNPDGAQDDDKRILLTAQWREIKTLTEWLSNWEKINAKDEGLGNNGVKINNSIIPSPSVAPIINNILLEPKKEGYGYKLELDLINPYNDLDENSNLELLARTIFVPAKWDNEKNSWYGRYKVPSNIKVADLSIFDGAQVSIGYKGHISLNSINTGFPNSYEVIDEAIGQINNTWQNGQNITPLIKAKYYGEEYIDNIRYEYSFDIWKEMIFEGTPGTKFEIIDSESKQSNIFITDENGFLKLSDYFIEKCTILKPDGTNNISGSITYKGYIVKKTYI